MRVDVNGIIMLEGYIEKVSFSEKKGKAFVEFSDGTLFEFRNGNSNRSDHVKKLRLQKGDKVIAIGAVNENSSLYVFGFDIQRSGCISKDCYFIFSGTVEKIVSMKEYSIFYINYGISNIAVVKALNSSEFLHISNGMEITCMCISNTVKDFSIVYENEKRNGFRKKSRRFIALEVERRSQWKTITA